jgi:hypothetical protein
MPIKNAKSPCGLISDSRARVYESIDGGIPCGKTGGLFIAKKKFFWKTLKLTKYGSYQLNINY